MARAKSTNSARIELRTTAEAKELLVRAAAREHLDLTSFIMRHVVPAAEEVVSREDRITLSERDTAIFLDLLENPPELTGPLLEAARRRQRRASS
jgi:uncharacterized protein (DUF1778 family)